MKRSVDNRVPRKKNALGFSLIELAVSVFIVGLVLTGVIKYLSVVAQSQREQATKIQQQAIRTALINFVSRNYRLPCPANRLISLNATGDGIEACTGLPTSGGVVVGVVPWATLGLSATNAVDTYGQRFTYLVTQSATSTALTEVTVSGIQGSITIHSSGPGIPGLAPAGNQINVCTLGNYNPCNAVVAIISHGANGYGGYTEAAQPVPFPLPTNFSDERANASRDTLLGSDADEKIVVKDYSGSDSNPFDDIVMTLTAGDVLGPLANSGSLKDYRFRVNEVFERIKGAIIANAIKNFTPSGTGGGSYPLVTPAGTAPNTTVPVTGAGAILEANQILDPWGSSIIYTRPTMSSAVTAATVSSQTAFTLTSYGPDTVASADDISVTVLVGDLQAIFAKVGF